MRHRDPLQREAEVPEGVRPTSTRKGLETILAGVSNRRSSFVEKVGGSRPDCL